MDIAVAVQTSGLVAEKKDLQEQLEETREELLTAYKTEQTAVVIADSMVVQLETAEDCNPLAETMLMFSRTAVIFECKTRPHTSNALSVSFAPPCPIPTNVMATNQTQPGKTPSSHTSGISNVPVQTSATMESEPKVVLRRKIRSRDYKKVRLRAHNMQRESIIWIKVYTYIPTIPSVWMSNIVPQISR